MNRRGFLKHIGLGTAAVVVTPTIIFNDPIPGTVLPIDGTEVLPELGEGLWQQLQKGNIVKYGTGGITKEHIREAVEYVFNQPVEPQERKVVFRTSDPMMARRIDDMFKKEVENGWGTLRNL